MILERFNEAIKCYDQAIELDPNYTDALNNKGIIFILCNQAFPYLI
jgi:Flp pilus assembly protein TadD